MAISRMSNASLHADYGRGTHTIHDVDLEADAQAEHIQEMLEKTFKAPNYTPPVLPAAALEIYRLSQQSSIDMQKVLAALEKDPMLAARVLKVASSPLFSAQPVPSLHAAIVRLGLRNLTAIVWEVATNLRIFRSKTYSAPMDSVRKHSTACAYVSRLVARVTSVPSEYAFLCGLLHDVGMAAALLVLSENTRNVVPDDVLAVALRSTHAEASSVVARLWNLPVDVQLVLGNHHLVSLQGYVHPAAAVVAIAEEIAGEHGFEFKVGKASWVDATQRTIREQARKALGLSEQSMRMLHTEADGVLKELAKAELTGP